MITNKEKVQIHNELLPFWLFYQVEHEVNDLAFDKLATNFKDADSYKIWIKQFIRINETLFYKHIVLLDRGAFITEINDQFNNYNIRCLDMNDWLKSTYELILNGLSSSKINLQSKSEFLEWYKIKIDELEKIKLNTQIEQLNPYPLIFLNEHVFNCFIEYKKHIIEFYTDYSYLKKQLEYLKLIHKQTDNDFMKFLLNDLKFITQKNYDDYCYKYESKLKSLTKSRSDARLNNFNIVFGQFI